MTQRVLVMNAGSSSLRWAVLDADSGDVVREGHQEHIGRGGPADHETAAHRALDELDDEEPRAGATSLAAVGHRVVHGGSHFRGPVLVDDTVISDIEALVPLAPLHLPGSLSGIAATRRCFPDVPHIAVFDTAFHGSLPASAYTYAVPRAWRERYGVRRYGFHGISYAYVARRAAELLGKPLAQTSMILLHLGNGASICAVRGGRSIDTSMGLSPVEGLVMGTRSGDVDPSLGPYLSRVASLDSEQYEDALNHASGLLGLCGTPDMKELEARRAGGDVDAALAFEVMAYRLRKYIGAYAVALGRVDAIAFTGGIGEHSSALRKAVLGDLAILGVELDSTANVGPADPERRITTPASAVAAYVIPTNEELEIARSCVQLLATTGQPHVPGA